MALKLLPAVVCPRAKAFEIVRLFGSEIISSDGMQLEKQFIQHGSVSVYAHSVAVAVMCVRLAMLLPFAVDLRALVRGALLHDYFLYDWHDGDKATVCTVSVTRASLSITQNAILSWARSRKT